MLEVWLTVVVDAGWNAKLFVGPRILSSRADNGIMICKGAEIVMVRINRSEREEWWERGAIVMSVRWSSQLHCSSAAVSLLQVTTVGSPRQSLIPVLG